MPITPARLAYAADGTPYSEIFADVYHSSDGGLGQAREAQVLLGHLGEAEVPEDQRFKSHVWRTALDHYRLFGIDDLEQASTYSTPQFVDQFGNFTALTQRYGGPALLKADLELVKQHLYVPMAP